MLKGIEGKTVLVTGAVGGIGKEFCRRMISEGANVIAVDLDPDEVVAELGPLAVPVTADVRTAKGAAAGVEAAIEHFGGLDLAFLNAGVETLAAPVVDFSEAEYERVFNVNVRGVFLCAQAVLKNLLGAGKPGSILLMASIGGLQGSPNTSVYNASKFAVIGLMKCLALEVGMQGVRVNALCPGIVDTRMMRSLESTMGAAAGMDAAQMKQALETNIAMGRYARPDEVAALAAWILSDDASYCHGETFTVGGGLMA